MSEEKELGEMINHINGEYKGAFEQIMELFQSKGLSQNNFYIWSGCVNI